MTSSPNRVRSPRGLSAILVLLSTALAACSGGSGGSAGPTATEAAAIFGAEKPATGSPVTIGFVYDGKSATLDNDTQFMAAEAVVQYANKYLGGLAGHPVTLEPCETKQTPSGAAACISQFVKDKVPVVLSGTSGQDPALYAPLARAGVPEFLYATLNPGNFAEPGISILGNGILTLIAGPAKLAADAGIKRAAILVIDVPSAAGALDQAAPLFFGKVGVTVDIVKVPPGTPDLTPQVQAEISKHNPGQFLVIGDENFCVAGMKALQTAGFRGQRLVLPNCITDKTASQVSNLDGTIVLAGTTSDPASKEFQLYNAILGAYAPKNIPRTQVTIAGYVGTLAFLRAVAGLEGPVTKESIKQTLLAMPPTPFPLADGITFQCNGKQVTVAPNMCSNKAFQTTLDRNGKERPPYKLVDGTTVLGP